MKDKTPIENSFDTSASLDEIENAANKLTQYILKLQSNGHSSGAIHIALCEILALMDAIHIVADMDGTDEDEKDHTFNWGLTQSIEHYEHEIRKSVHEIITKRNEDN
ncbi:MAG TPA: hypothetical protein QF753_00830 [Victivallales bacterium]|nr:hypothetical protein [Victivallales bacterium]